MQQLGISDIADVMIGTPGGSGTRGLSGGEMRRVSIGLELVAGVEVLILDEPVSLGMEFDCLAFSSHF